MAPSIRVPDVGNPLSFRPVKEEAYVYELPDGTVLRVRFRLQRLSRSQFGTFAAEGTTEALPETTGQDRMGSPAGRFEYPKLLHEGCYSYVTAQREPVRLRPSLTLVERTFGVNDVPRYIASAFWMADADRAELMRANTWPSTFATVGGSGDAMTQAVTRERELLEWLFQGRTWFAERGNERHPAYVDWRLCDSMARWGGRKPDSLKSEDLRFAARISLNTMYMIRLSGGDLNQMTPGMFEAFGDGEVQKKIRTRVPDPEKYKDLLVELYTASWHVAKDRRVSLLERTSYPDIRISVESLAFPIYIECKRLKVSSVNQIQSDVRDASRQIRTASQGADSNAYGAVLLDFSSLVGLPRQENDSLPQEVADVMQKVRQAISGDKNTHVRSAIVVWDDYGLVGQEPQQMLVFRRRARILHHSLNRSPLPPDKLFDGYAVRMMLRQIPDEML